MRKILYKSEIYYRELFDRRISNKLRKDVDSYIIFEPNFLYDSDDERIELIEKLKKIRNEADDDSKKKYDPLISMLSEGKIIGLRDSDIVID